MIGSALVAFGLLLPQGGVSQPAQAVLPKPDLVIASVTVAPDRIEQGGTAQLTVSVRNMGSVGSAAAQVGVTVKRDAGSAPVYSHNFPLAATAAGATKNLTLTVPFADSVAAGGYTIHILADSTRKVVESDELNNAGVPLTVMVVEAVSPPGQAAFPRPDLVIAQASVAPDRIERGATTHLRVDVRNIGSVGAGRAQVGVTVKRSAGSPPVYSHNFDLAPTAAGHTLTLGLPVTFAESVAAGGYTIDIVADATGSVIERDESNNAGIPLTIEVVEPGPPPGRVVAVRPDVSVDLVVRRVRLTRTSARSGETVNVLFDVANEGNAAVTASTAAVRLSTASSVDAGVAAVGLLHPDGTEPVSIPITVPTVTRETSVRVTAIADSPGAFDEPDEANNRGTAALQVLPPPRANLVIDNLTVSPGTVARGGSVHVHFQLVNRGDLDATAMATHYYLSSSPTGEPRIPIEDLGSSGLDAGFHWRAYDFDVVIPATTTPGARYFCVRADGGNQVVESSETDNMVAVPITVQ